MSPPTAACSGGPWPCSCRGSRPCSWRTEPLRKSRSGSAETTECIGGRCVIASVRLDLKETTMSTAPYASTRIPQRQNPDAHAIAGIVAVMLGILVAILGFFAVLMWVDSHNARDAANRAANRAASATSMPGMDMSSSATAGSGLTSYAGAAPANADALAAAHKAFPATLPAVPAGAGGEG